MPRQTSAEGIITVYGYNELKQKVSETKKGLAADGSEDINTLYTYDLENRVLSTAVTNVASSLGYVASRSAYDAVGRVTNAVDRLGNSTVTAYDTLVTSVRSPNGVNAVTERYLDGKTKRVLENGVVKQSYAHGVNPDGTRWTLFADGPLPVAIQSSFENPRFTGLVALDFPWSLTISDFLGHTVAKETPGFGHVVLVISNAYDSAENLFSSTEYAISQESVVPVILVRNLYTYAADGTTLLTVLDINTNGVIDLSGPDRITGSCSSYEKDDSKTWWNVSRSWVYPEYNSVLAITSSVQRVKVTGLGEEMGLNGTKIAHVEMVDLRGNRSVSERMINRDSRQVTQYSSLPTSSSGSVRKELNGLVQNAISLTSVTSSYGYDVFENRCSVTDGRGGESHMQHNLFGQTIYEEDAASNGTSYAYDALGRRTTVVDAVGNATHVAYDADGRVIATWGATHPVAYEYDKWGHIVAMATTRDPAAASTNLLSLLPDGGCLCEIANRLPELSNCRLDITRWFYDNSTGLLTNKLYANGKGPSYSYTFDKRLAMRRWARDVVTEYDYSMDGLLYSVHYSDTTPDVAYTYNRIGKVLSAISSVSTNEYVYSVESLDMESEFQNGLSIVRSTDEFGRSCGFSVGEDYEVNYQYDDSGRLRRIIARDGEFLSTNIYSYVPGADLLSKSAAGPLTHKRIYEDRRDLQIQVCNKTKYGVVSQFDYLNDSVGRRVLRVDSGLTFSTTYSNRFGYNMCSEITNCIIYSNDMSFAYDPIGNKVSEFVGDMRTNIYGVNSMNQYSNIWSQPSGLETLSYDVDGNMIADGIWSYSWDAENRLIDVTSNGVPCGSFVYDHLSRRITKATPITINRYYYDGWAVIRDVKYNSSSNTLSIGARNYYYGLDTSGTFQGAGSIGGLWLSHSYSGAWYYCYDGNGNVSEILNDDGVVIGHYEYGPFGSVLDKAGERVDENIFGFSTKMSDAETGLIGYGYRYLSPRLGRWLSLDPIGNRGGANLYCFVFNSPIIYTDRLGLQLVLHPAVDDTLAQIRSLPGQDDWYAYTSRTPPRLAGEGSFSYKDEGGKHCAKIDRAKEIVVDVFTVLPNDAVGVVLTADGLSAVKAHENRRRLVVELGFDFFLKPVELGGALALKCGWLCCCKDGEAQQLLQAYMNNIRGAAYFEYNKYVNEGMDGIDKENEHWRLLIQADGRVLRDGYDFIYQIQRPKDFKGIDCPKCN